MGDLFARMRVPGGQRSLVEVDAHLDDLASGDAKIVLQQVAPPDSRRLRPRRLHRQSASADQHHYRHGSYRFHFISFLLTTKLTIESSQESAAVLGISFAVSVSTSAPS